MVDSPPDRTVDTASVVISLLIVLAGVGVLGALVYAEWTTDLEGDYERFSQSCDTLDGQAILVEGGLGMQAETLNETHVRACEDMTFAEYRENRYRSIRSTPLNLKQWGWFGGGALALVAGGSALLWRQFNR